MNKITRVFLSIVGIGTLVYALAVVVFGAISLSAQLATGTIRPTMYWADNLYQFADNGDGHGGVAISGSGGSFIAAVTGVSGGVIAIYVTATVVSLLTQFALATLALRLLGRLRSGRPFADGAWKSVVGSSLLVLGFGVIGQLLAWWSRVAIISEAGGVTFSRSFVFDPLAVTIALALMLVGAAFRTGEKLQHDTEGLV